MNNFVREALNATMPVTPPAPLDWIMALGAGQVVVVDDSQTSVTLNLQQGDVVRGPFHKLTSTTITSGLRYGVGLPPTPGNVTGQNAVSGVTVPTGPIAGQLLQATGNQAGQWVGPVFGILPVAAVSVANQATMTGLAQTVDGVALNTAGMRVALWNQTTASQNGIWVVQAGAWTRPPDWATGNTPPLGTIVVVAPGGTNNFSLYGSQWFVQTTGVIDTATVTAYPRVFKKTVTLAAGTYTVGAGGGGEALWLLAGAVIELTSNTHAGTLGTNRIEAPSASRTTGVAGTAAFVINSLVDAGTVAGSDTSTVDVLLTQG